MQWQKLSVININLIIHFQIIYFYYETYFQSPLTFVQFRNIKITIYPRSYSSRANDPSTASSQHRTKPKQPTKWQNQLYCCTVPKRNRRCKRYLGETCSTTRIYYYYQNRNTILHFLLHIHNHIHERSIISEQCSHSISQQYFKVTI